MTNATLRNILWYVAIAIGAATLATGVQLGVALSGTEDLAWRPLAATFTTTLFGTLMTSAGTAFRPKAGREDVSSLVSEIGPQNAVAALEVEAIKQSTGVDAPMPALSDEDVDRLARRGLELMREAEAERVRDVPAFVRRGSEDR